MPGYQPFLISEFKTGLFDYLQPWIRPAEAFEPLEDAFIYRGVLQKRNGFQLYGQMSYEDVIGVGTGGMSYSGTLPINPILAGSFTPTDGIESFTDNGAGVLTGSAGGSGTINYTTGAWTLAFNANVANGVLITWTYSPVSTYSLVVGARPIMGIKQWTNETTGDASLIIMDTRRASIYNATTNMFDPLNLVEQIILTPVNATGSPVTTTYVINLGWAGIAPYTNGLAPGSVSITDGISTITDLTGSGTFTTSGRFTPASSIVYSSGVLTLKYAVPANTVLGTVTITLSGSLAGDYFTGNQSNFFNATNWLGDMYMVNNADPITTFDGTNLGRPAFPITLAHRQTGINDIATALDIDVYKNRFLVQRPTLVGSGSPSGQSIRYSSVQNPTNLVADVPGNGGELSAPTDDFIQSSEFLRDQLLVFFTNSVWTFRFTGNSFDPFRWDKINNTKSTSAPYGTVAYDERVTAMGNKGLIACDGVNVQRYDMQIIDQFDKILQSRFQQCFGQRFDEINQTWICFPSEYATASPAGPILSDSILIYNFFENTWAVYDISMSCLGTFMQTVDAKWDEFAVGQYYYNQGFVNWAACEFPWNQYLLQNQAPILLGGGEDGMVYILDDGNTDHGTPINCSISSTQWNPFSKIGEKVQFGYIDFYYQIEPNAVLTLTFFIDNIESPCATRTLTCDGNPTANKNMKRIYINSSGEFLKMNIQSSSPDPFQIYGLVLWARPAGRLTP